MRTHLKRLARNTGRVDPRLRIQPPEAGRAVWEVFCAVSTGAAPLTWLELDAWQRVNRIELTAWERDTVMAMDRAVIEQLAQQRAAQTSAMSQQQRNRKP